MSKWKKFQEDIKILNDEGKEIGASGQNTNKKMIEN